MGIYDYTQNEKKRIRHNVLLHAVNNLTIERGHTCCVPRSYVRDVVDYFLLMGEEESAYQEAKKINSEYISAWESLHDSIIGYKRPSDLSVCYLSGPQPQNDFNELIALGVLPQNIWAFECDWTTYLNAVASYDKPVFPQPKIIRMSVEHFFKQSPKKFDIVYIDACGAIPSNKHALRSVATLFQYQRLNSPGVLITNFAKPDINNIDVKNQYIKLIATYLFFKEYPNAKVGFEKDNINIKDMNDFYYRVSNNFDGFYGDFISSILSDIPAVIVPLQRFACIAPYSNIFCKGDMLTEIKETTIEEINEIKNNSICKWILSLDFMRNKGLSAFRNTFSSICTEILGMDGSWDALVKGIKIFIKLKNENAVVAPDVADIRDFFKKTDNFYQFLDKPTISLFYDMMINQLSYPLHYNTEYCERYIYCAKKTDMFSDLIVFDECRYLYEWLPAIHQIVNAMKNKSWQYVFRFALDGLVKQRLNYNNEFFFQGSVIPKWESGFSVKTRKERVRIGD